jgi:transposase
MDLTNEQWERLKVHLPEPQKLGMGRPRRDNREVLNGILWVLKTGARWQDLPERYGSYQTCHRRFQEWVKLGVIEKMLEQLARDLHEQGDLDLSECFIDGSFVAAKKGVSRLGKPRKERVQNLWSSQMRQVFQSPLSLQVLLPMKSPLLRARSIRFLLTLALYDLSETEPMTATHLMQHWQNAGLN